MHDYTATYLEMSMNLSTLVDRAIISPVSSVLTIQQKAQCIIWYTKFKFMITTEQNFWHIYGHINMLQKASHGVINNLKKLAVLT